MGRLTSGIGVSEHLPEGLEAPHQTSPPFLQLCGSPELYNRLGRSLLPTYLLWEMGREQEKTALNVRGNFWDQHFNLSFSAGKWGLKSKISQLLNPA